MKINWKLIESNVKDKADGDIPDVVAQVLANRGIDDPEAFFSSDFEELHDPFLIYDMDRAVDRILQAVEKKEKIVVYGDYDVDGVCATSVLWNFYIVN